ncbi:hypothetical protein [Aeromicrobium sp.]|uniref:hypothetical protein n=1 Tax=Aeromicrobium sp. TaxID=1871063 RepID=UPI003C40F7F8
MTFTASMFAPVALGFFGLGTGYLIWGPAELLGFPTRSSDPAEARSTDRALGVWGMFLPGLCQLMVGVLLFVGLTWFQVFTDDSALYMAAVAFSAYGIHWFALGWNKFQGNDARTNAGMSVAFTVLSVVGAVVFFDAGAWPVGLLFAGLTAVYVTDFFVGIGIEVFEKVLGVVHIVVGLWLMYLTVAVILNTASGFDLPS